MHTFEWEGLRVEQYVVKRRNRTQRRDTDLFLKKEKEVVELLLELFRSTNGRFPGIKEANIDTRDEDVKEGIHHSLKVGLHTGRGYELFLAYKGGALVGFFGLIHNVLPTITRPSFQVLMSEQFPGFKLAKATMLRLICVKPRWQRRGVGGALLRLSLERANELNKQLFSFIDPRLKENVGFYRHYGAQVVERDLKGFGYPFVFP